MRIRFTQHALRRMAQRQLAREWIEAVLEKPDRVMPDPVDSQLTRAYRRLPQVGGRTMRVVYLSRGQDWLVITAFLDRDAD
jgi:hypothetical protein